MKPEKTIFAPDASPLAVAILLMEESNAFSLAACVDPMRAANRRAGRTLFTWQYLSPAGGQVALTAGFGVATQALGDRADYDVLMIVAGFRLEEQATSDLLARLRRLAPQLKAMGGVDGGKIEVESELGRGSCFYFSAPFPVVAPAEPAAGQPATVVR